MIIVNTGNGKGKTTAAIGQIIRALGRDFKVCVIQLFKEKDFYGEQHILKQLDNLNLYSFASRHPACHPEISKKTVKKQCDKAYNKLKDVLNSKIYDLIVLDEFNIALKGGYIRIDDLIKLLRSAKNNTDIVLTGRYAPKELIKAADMVTEMKEIKHPFNNGIPAKKGLEF